MGLKEELAAERAAMAALAGDSEYQSSREPAAAAPVAAPPPAAAPAPAVAPVAAAPKPVAGPPGAWAKKTLLAFTVTDVQEWLSSIGMDELQGPFKDNDIDGPTLDSMVEDDLKDESSGLYIKSIGLRKKFMREVEALKPPSSKAPAMTIVGATGGPPAAPTPAFEAPKAVEIEPVVVTKYATAQNVVVENGKWTRSLFWCAGGRFRLKVCLFALACPCIIEGKIAAVVNFHFKQPMADMYNTEFMQWENCLLHVCTGGCLQFAGTFSPIFPFAYFMSCAGCFASFMRVRVREKYGIKGNQVMDAMTHWCCYPCALVQEYEELKLRIERPDNHTFLKLKFLDD